MYYYIVNPIAGGGAFDKIQQEFEASLKLKKIEGEIAKTSVPGEARKLAKAAIKKGNRVVVAVGGDATVEEVVNGIVESEQAGVALGIIPMGKNNYFANSINLSDWQHAVNSLATSQVKRLGLAQVEEYYFLGSLDFGFAVNLEDRYLKQDKLNPWSRFRIALDEIKKTKPISFRLKVGSNYWADLEVVAGSFGNSFFFNHPNSFSSDPNNLDSKLTALFLHPFEKNNLWLKAREFSRFNFGSINQYSLIKEKSFILEAKDDITFKTAAVRFKTKKLRFAFHKKALSVIVSGIEK